jgi:hypothetical protein
MADPKPHIFDGTKWLPLQGADGAEGPTVVSADPKNLAKIGTDGKLLVSQPDLDAIYVNLAGDNMTGPLTVKAPQPAGTATVSSLVTVAAETGRAIARITNANEDANGPFLTLRKDRGTLAAPTPVKANDQLGQVRWAVPNGTGERTAGVIGVTAAADGTATGCDSFMQISVQAANVATTATGITLRNTVATGRTFECAADNFAITASGNITASGGNFIVNNTQAKSTVTAGDSVTAIGFYGAGVGTSATSGGVTGVRGEVTGTVSTGIGVIGNVTATATQNFGLQAIVSGGTRNCGLYVDVPKASGSYAVQFQGDADSYFKSNVGIGWSTPTVALEVGGATKLRTTLEVVGNITSTGTAHNFAAKSIPASAINGVPTLKADDLTDVTVTTPAAGQVLRYNGTAFVNAKLNFSDLSGTQTNPTINAPSIFKVFGLAAGQTDAGRACAVMSAAPVASATITGVQGYQGSPTGSFGIFSLILGKVNTVTKVFVGGVATYSGWVSMSLGADERHACVFPGGDSNITGQKYSIRYYTATENSNWSTEVQGTF